MSKSVAQNPKTSPEPLVSVLVPSYNHEKYVIECLESIKSLNYRRLELILSDDCSPDRTFIVAEQWAQRNADRFERCSIVRQEKNLGIVKNLQFLFDSAQGEYLTYIASDDAFVEAAITSRVALLQESPNLDAVFGNAQLISESGSVLREEFISKRVARELASAKLLISSLILNWCVPGPVMMLRRAAVLEDGSLGPLPDDLRTEDWYIYFRLAIRGRLRYVNEVVAKYRMVQSSMSQSTSQFKVRVACLIQVDNANRYLLTGFNRILIETRIARFKLELNKGHIVFDMVSRAFWRYIICLQRALLFISALVLTDRYIPNSSSDSNR
jgi:glycosyltransferase involved in cell wall biosynthesis